MTVQVKWHGAAVKQRVKSAAARGLMLGAEHVLEVSGRIVPVAPDGGTLMGSGATDIDEGKLEATVYYDTPYARRQHEELTYRHAPGRKAKYLEDPANTERSKVDRLVAQEIKKTLG